MNTIQLLASALGLGLLSGISLYSTVLAVGLGVRFGILDLMPELESLQVLADPIILIAAGILFLVEFLADKVPWLDSAWDAIHTFIRPLGAVALATTALGDIDPVFKVALVLICGGAALSGHSAKAATRLAVNHSPEPFTNIALSLGEDMLVPVGVWLTLNHPYVMLALAGTFLAVFTWLSPKIIRLLRLEMNALGGVVRKLFLSAEPAEIALPAPLTAAHVQPIATLLRERATPTPEGFGPGPGASGVQCAPYRGVRGLHHSTGYLCCDTDRLVFVTRRWMRPRRHEIPLASITATEFRTKLLLDRLRLTADGREQSFYVMKG